jgi:hypothetical protein
MQGLVKFVLVIPAQAGIHLDPDSALQSEYQNGFRRSPE